LNLPPRPPAAVADRVVLFDPDQPNPPTINPLSGDDPDLVVDNLVSIFGTIFAKAWGPRMDDHAGRLPDPVAARQRHPATHPTAAQQCTVPVGDDRRPR